MTIQIVKRGKPILFDSQDWSLVHPYSWYVDANGYACYNLYVNGKFYEGLKMHRVILGVKETSILVDHVNRQKTDNRRINLRVTDPSGNSRNTSSSGKVKYLGVIQRPPGPYQKSPRYVARIWANQKMKYLGTFKTMEDAALAYNRAATEYFGEFASLNKV